MFLRASDYPAIFRWKEVFYRCFVFDLILLSDFLELLIESGEYAFPQQDSIMVLLKAHKVNATIINWKDLPVRFYLYFKLRTKIKPYHIQYEMQCLFATAEKHHIIHIAEIVKAHSKLCCHYLTQYLLNPVIEIRQIEVGKILACKVADWQTLFFTVTIYNLIQQPQQLTVSYTIAYDPFQCRVIHTIVELPNAMVNNPIRKKRSYHYNPLLWLIDDFHLILSGLVRFVSELPVEIIHIA